MKRMEKRVNKEKLNKSIKEYIKQIKRAGDIEAIKERKNEKNIINLGQKKE